MPFVGQAEGKGVYERYHSVPSNFANLNLCTGGNRNGKRLRGWIISQRLLYIIIRYIVYVVYIITWRGLAALLILT